MSTRSSVGLAGVVILVATVACYGGAPVATSPGAITTIVAATMRAITPQVPTPTLAIPTAGPVLPAPAPTSSTMPTRINFLSGATTGVVNGSIAPGQILSYVLQAGQGEPILVQVMSPEREVTLSIRTDGGTSLLPPSAKQSSWKGTIPQTEDYLVTVYGGATNQQFTLIIEIVSRISFATGADSARMNGQAPPGYGVAYTVFAVKDQRVDVAVYGVGTAATLTVWGFADGRTYLKAAANRTSFTFTVPMTQDYILQLDPKGNEALEYTVYVKIQ